MSPVLEFRNVSCALDNQLVVKDINFTIKQGEIMCLMGWSGCGKTTCLRLAGGLETPKSGEIYLNGELVSAPEKVVPPEQRGLGFLFQDYALFPHLSVYENVCFGISNLPTRDRDARAHELLEAVGLEDFADRYPDALSGGEQQRVALARALAPKPQLVLMDEPFSGLDLPRRDKIRDLTKTLIKASGAAGLITTHDVADAFRVADYMAVQESGRIVESGTPQEIYMNSKNMSVIELFGGANITTDEQNRPTGFRAADIRLTAGGDDYSFVASVIHKQPEGAGYLYLLERDDAAETPTQAFLQEDIAIGSTHKFYVPRAHLVLFNEKERISK